MVFQTDFQFQIFCFFRALGIPSNPMCYKVKQLTMNITWICTDFWMILCFFSLFSTGNWSLNSFIFDSDSLFFSSLFWNGLNFEFKVEYKAKCISLSLVVVVVVVLHYCAHLSESAIFFCFWQKKSTIQAILERISFNIENKSQVIVKCFECNECVKKPTNLSNKP